MSNISNLFGYAKFCNIDCCWTYWELKSEKISWLNQHDKFNKHTSIIRMINNVNCHRFFIDFSQDQRYYLNTLKWKYRIRHIQYYWFLQSEKINLVKFRIRSTIHILLLFKFFYVFGQYYYQYVLTLSAWLYVLFF